MQSAHGTYTESNLLLKAFRVFFLLIFVILCIVTVDKMGI
jgi:hypothetical protein